MELGTPKTTRKRHVVGHVVYLLPLPGIQRRLHALCADGAGAALPEALTWPYWVE